MVNNNVQSRYITLTIDIQPDQINMALFYWYLLKSDPRLRYCTVAYTRNTTPCLTGDPVKSRYISYFDHCSDTITKECNAGFISLFSV